MDEGFFIPFGVFLYVGIMFVLTKYDVPPVWAWIIAFPLTIVLLIPAALLVYAPFILLGELWKKLATYFKR